VATPDYLDQKTFLAHLSPFSQLPEPELERLAQDMTVGHYRAGEVLLKPASGQPVFLSSSTARSGKSMATCRFRPTFPGTIPKPPVKASVR